MKVRLMVTSREGKHFAKLKLLDGPQKGSILESLEARDSLEQAIKDAITWGNTLIALGGVVEKNHLAVKFLN